VAAYGAAAVTRPEWWDHELAKLHRAASDRRWRVREIVAAALQRLLASDWDRAIDAVRAWAVEDDPLVVRAAAAGVAEPPLLRDLARAKDAIAVQRRAVQSLRALPAEHRRHDDVRTLRQALGYTISVVVAATGDFGLLEELAGEDDPDMAWVVKANLGKARLRRWPEAVSAVRDRLEDRR
jgi:hypothetical protein